jgi:aquaporin Z
VTIAILVRGQGKIPLLDAAVYIISQLLGGLLGALVSWALLIGGKDAAAFAAPGASVSASSALICEFMLTLALCSVVLHVATSKAQANNSYYGLAIGFTVLSGAVSVGGISGGAFNPAVGFMSVLYGTEAARSVWIYFVGPILGGVAAGGLFRLAAYTEYSDVPNAELELTAALLVEFLGTMMLCFTVGTAAGLGSFLAPLSIGSILMVMIYMGGAVSGAHYNPAVTIAVALRTKFGATHDKFSITKACMYIPAQLLGAFVGALAAVAAIGSLAAYPALPAASGIGHGFFGEVIGTFLLVYVILNVATVKALAGNSFFGLAIGMVVTAMACAIGPISGGAFNPAVGLMGLFINGGVGDAINDIWIYWIACPLGAALAAAFFRPQNLEEFKPLDFAVRFMTHAPLEADKQKFHAHAHVGALKSS